MPSIFYSKRSSMVGANKNWSPRLTIETSASIRVTLNIENEAKRFI